MLKTLIPMHWAKAGYGIPTVCTRHGRPQAKRLSLSTQSSPEPWTYALLLAGVIVFLIVRAATRKYAQLPAWPLCEQCVQTHRTFQLSGGAVTLIGAAAFAYGFTLSRFDMGPFILAGGVTVVIGLILFLLTSRARIARAQVSRDGRWLEVRRASPEFAAALGATMAAVQQTYVTQPGYWTGPVPAQAIAPVAQATAPEPVTPAPDAASWSMPR